MNAATQEIVFNVSGQSLVYDSLDGRPSAIASQVFHVLADDDGEEESATTGSWSVETNPNTTLSAASGASEGDPTLLTVTSGTGFSRDRVYQITEDSTGVTEVFQVAGVNGTLVYARHPLKNAYTAGAAVVSCRSSISMDSTWVSDSENVSPTFSPNPSYRVRVVATVGGASKVRDIYFDLVRYPAVHQVTPLDVDRAFPGWLDTLPPDYQADQGRALIDAAFASVKFELYREGKADQAVRNAELLARLVIKRCPVELLEANALRGAGNAEALQIARDGWRAFFEGVFHARVAPMDHGHGGATPGPPSNWLRR